MFVETKLPTNIFIVSTFSSRVGGEAASYEPIENPLLSDINQAVIYSFINRDSNVPATASSPEV